MSEFIWQATEVNRWIGGVAGAEFSTDVTFSQWFCSLINVCSSLQSLLCLFERNIALQPKIQGNLGDLYAQNDLKVAIPFQSVHSANSVRFPLSRKIIGPKSSLLRFPLHVSAMGYGTLLRLRSVHRRFARNVRWIIMPTAKHTEEQSG